MSSVTLNIFPGDVWQLASGQVVLVTGTRRETLFGDETMNVVLWVSGAGAGSETESWMLSFCERLTSVHGDSQC
jgi:hypothetical protein